MDKLGYHYNKKKLPAKTAGKYLYYYPCADIKNATTYMGGHGFIVIEATEKEWEALIELDRIEYNNEHKYVRNYFPTYVRPDIVDIWMGDSPQRLVGKVYTHFPDKFMYEQMQKVEFPVL